MMSFQNKDGLKSQTILDAVGTPPNTARPTTQRNMSPVRMEFGQSQEAPMTVVSTSTNNMSGNDQSSNEIGSVFIDGKRQSAWANYSYSANGISAADKLVMDKATRRAAERNLDSSVATP